MHLRRFTAENISKALEMVKAELGSDAIILSTEKKRKKDPKSSGFVSYTEVVAAADRMEAGNKKGPRTAPLRKPAPRREPPVSVEELSRQVTDMKKSLAHMTRLLETLITRGKKSAPVDQAASTGIDRVSLVENTLLHLRLDHETGRLLTGRILSSFSHNEITRDQLISWLRNHLISSFRNGPVAGDTRGPLWWAFIGPTGVGKTTTLAKIAAHMKFLRKQKGLLVSVDSYRLGAVEQLDRYARLMGLPLETARTTKDLLRIFSCHKDKDFILLDTTGRNPSSSSHRTELQRLFDAVPGLMAQVMLCSTYKREDLMESINFYRTFPIAGWSLTKTDETKSLASTLFTVLEAKIPISYLTNGQRVPEDIKVPDVHRLCTDLFGTPGGTGDGARDISGHMNATLF